jgi:hypothetical protein
MYPSPEDIQRTFFAAMRAGYTGGASKTHILGLPGSKVIVFEQGQWLVKDIYFTHRRSDYSSGMTVITCGGEPVWTMSYQGYYEKDVIPFLKRALAASYDKEEWSAGRGPKLFFDDRLTYRNEIGKAHFNRFWGREEISNSATNRVRGYHDYHGVLYQH